MPKITVKVNNRWRLAESVAKATVTAGKPGPLPNSPPTLVDKTTNAQGKAEFDVKDLADGKYKFTIIPKDSWIGDVGPNVASGSVPERIFRILELDVEIRAGVIVSARVAKNYDSNGSVAVAGGAELRVTLQPVWMKSPAHSSRGKGIDMIVVHHTDCNRQIALDTFMSEKGPHYMIDTDGQVLKLVQESQAAWHAGPSYWAGRQSVNANSIGIEIVNIHDPYSEAQYKSLLNLLDALLAANPGVDRWNIVGHSDISLGDDGVLGRKSGDPGSKFEWVRVEQKGWGLLEGASVLSPDAYGGFFSQVRAGSLRQGDNDTARRWGGEVRKDGDGLKISGQPVKELQQDLQTIGYYVGTPDGGFGLKTFAAVRAIKEHFFAGGRGTDRPDGAVDSAAALLIKSVVALHPGT